jgi:hypothetical protein
MVSEACSTAHDEPGMNFLRLFALRDVADVALNHFFVTGLIDVADKLHGNLAAILCFQRQVVITDIPVLLKTLQYVLVGHDVLERT